MRIVFIAFVVSLGLMSCEEECKTCYFIEANNGVPVNEHLIGELCGDDLEDEEAKTYDCIAGDCYSECRNE